jgi:hypothetical protein
VSLGARWEELRGSLPAGWSAAQVRLRPDDPGALTRAAALLGPLQPVLSAEGTLTFRVASDGSGPQADTVARLLRALDRERLRGTLELVSSDEPPPPRAEQLPQLTIAESWDLELSTLPADWSDLLGEVELDSSDYLERTALHLAPINPRRDGDRLALRFRCARRFGYGASPEMVRRCFERCDEEGFRGRARVLRVLSDTRPVQTQGPVWQLSGRTV